MTKIKRILRFIIFSNKSDKKKIEYWKINTRFLTFLLTLSFIFIAYILIYLYETAPSDYSDIVLNSTYKLNFNGSFSDAEKEYYQKEIINPMNPMFLQFLGNVTIYKNFTLLWKICDSGADGCNVKYSNGGGRICVYLHKRIETDREILCHEIFHNILLGNKTSEVHPVIYYLAKKQICY